ncbi:ABC transporter ATP-binding protein [Mycoplasmopsis opalescens]|uniref:ABC transporter ATP-binding protein n=1 Tax=Mycoplasmopsis opalescens TaxID=114886 RepID=UPI0004A6D708|nr:ABC transporter ATP-binding protein [Mycoplasmopsis opalescens]
MSAIEFKNVSKIFNKKNTVLNNISFVIENGEFHGFIGANGAGKTTTIRTLLGFYPDFKGEITINETSNKDASVKSIIGYIPEAATFPKSLNIFDFLVDMALLYGIEKKEAKQKVSQILMNVGVEENLWKRYGNNLSSGQQKRVMLAQALLNDPQILILDEPAANLDPAAREDLYKKLKELNQKNKITIFISSHILRELEMYIDSVTVLDKGEIKFSGTFDSIKQNNYFGFKIVSKKITDLEQKLELLKKSLDFQYQKADKNTILIRAEKNVFNLIASDLFHNGMDIDYCGINEVTLSELYFSVKSE